MPTSPSTSASSQTSARLPLLRLSVGGVLMGLANLVPGVSGGTMLLAAGVYQRFIDAVADLSAVRLGRSAILTVGVVAIAAGLAIALGAAGIKGLVLEHRWAMYSLFIGLTLGGAPTLLRLARPFTPAAWGGFVFGIAAMLAMAFLDSTGGVREAAPWWLLCVAGVAGASAMILPGVSGAYLLLLLGVYLPVLGAVDAAKEAARALLSGDAGAVEQGIEAAKVVVPIGIGVVAGVAGVSNLVRWMLHRFEKATLGALTGLLFGAVAGLWPFVEVVASTDETVAEHAKESVRSCAPESAMQVGVAISLVVVGFGATWAIGRFGNAAESETTSASV